MLVSSTTPATCNQSSLTLAEFFPTVWSSTYVFVFGAAFVFASVVLCCFVSVGAVCETGGLVRSAFLMRFRTFFFRFFFLRLSTSTNPWASPSARSRAKKLSVQSRPSLLLLGGGRHVRACLSSSVITPQLGFMLVFVCVFRIA